MTRDELLTTADNPYAPVPVKLGRGRRVHVRALDAVELAACRTLSAKEPDTWPVWLALHGVCDESGNRLLTVEDFDAFKRRGVEVHQIARKVSSLTGLDESEEDAGND